MTLRRRYLDVSTGQLHVRVADGPEPGRRPVVCFHLSPLSGSVYESLLNELARDRTAVAPDTPGFGMSDAPAAPPSIEDYACVMSETIDALGLREVDCVGYHTGSRIAVELSRLRPDAVRHLVLVSTPVYTDDERAQMRREFAERPIREDGGHLLDEWRNLLRWRGADQTLDHVMKHFPDQVRAGVVKTWGHRAAFAHDYREALPALRVPTLVINPEDDLTVYTRRAAGMNEHLRVLERPEWGHGLLDTHTAEFAALLRGFCDG